MASRGVSHVEDLVGEELPYFVRASDLDRTTVVYPVINHDTCIGCHLCYLICPTDSIGLSKRVPKRK